MAVIVELVMAGVGDVRSKARSYRKHNLDGRVYPHLERHDKMKIFLLFNHVNIITSKCMPKAL